MPQAKFLLKEPTSKKLFLVFALIVFLSVGLCGQTIRENKYINDSVGISFQMDSNWRMGVFGRLVYAYNIPKKEEVTLEIIPMLPPDTNGYRYITDQELEYLRVTKKKALEEDGATVKSIEVRKSKFLNYDCTVSIYHTENQPLLNGIPLFYKEIIFMINENYQAGFIYSMPDAIVSETEINAIEKQLMTFKDLRSLPKKL